MSDEWQPGGKAWEEMMEIARTIGNLPGEAPKRDEPNSNVVPLKTPSRTPKIRQAD
jgi:hypothetical protein